MNESRLPRICLTRQIKLMRNPEPATEYNWAVQLNVFLDNINIRNLWATLSSEVWSESFDLALERYERYLRFTDVLRYNRSESKVHRISRTLEDKTSFYLLRHRKFFLTKIFAQLRLTSRHFVRFTYKGKLYSCDQNLICSLCNMNERETLEHVLFDCPRFKGYRDFYFNKIKLNPQNKDRVTELCIAHDDSIIKNICFFIIVPIVIICYYLLIVEILCFK